MYSKALLKAALTGLLFAVPAFAQHDHNHMAVNVSGGDYSFESPETLETGYQTLTFTNTGKELHHLQLVRLNDGVTLEQFQAAMPQGEAAMMPLVELVGGVGLVVPGQTATATVHLEKPGIYVELCFVPDANGVPHLALGMVKPIEVVASSVTTEAPKADLVVDMHDFAFTIPGELNAGTQTWEVVNHGEQPHELMLGKIQEGKTLEDVMAYLQTGQFGPDLPLDLMGGAQGMSTGHSTFVTYDLEPGNYVALCFIPDPKTGLPHLALGMISHFTAVEKTAQN
jgi:plastocyanin